MNQIPDFTKVELNLGDEPEPDVDKWGESFHQEAGQAFEDLVWSTPEGSTPRQTSRAPTPLWIAFQVSLHSCEAHTPPCTRTSRGPFANTPVSRLLKTPTPFIAGTSLPAKKAYL